MGRSEELGTGVKNVFKYSMAYSGSDNITFSEDDIFTTTIPLTANKQDGTANGELNEGLTSLLTAIKNNLGIQANKLVALLDNRPLKTIERQLKTLIERHYIQRIGSKKTGGYVAIKM